MLKILDLGSEESNKDISSLLSRSQLEFSSINIQVEAILKDIKDKGDEAVRDYTQRFDGVEITNSVVTKEEIEEAYNKTDSYFIKALVQAKDNIEKYHLKQLNNSWIDISKPGITLGQIYNPMDRIGVYVPGGTAPYPSTVLMNVIPAKVAGVGEIVMVTPPSKDGGINNNILAAAKIAGVDRIYKVGGAQAIGALAFGTETIPRVHKIVGPGNIYVAIAKKLVYGNVDIDMIAGPSEILIIADEKTNPEYIAADLLSQAEHDTLASSILITTSMNLAKRVKEQLDIQIRELSREGIMKQALKDNGAIIVVNSLDEAIEFSNNIAPEHLELMVEKPFEMINKIKNAGAIFMGEFTPEPLGDYFAGPNHTLPTSGTSKFFSPLGVYDFFKRTSLIYYNKAALMECKDKVIKMAEVEGLTAHANSIRVRCR